MRDVPRKDRLRSRGGENQETKQLTDMTPPAVSRMDEEMRENALQLKVEVRLERNPEAEALAQAIRGSSTPETLKMKTEDITSCVGRPPKAPRLHGPSEDDEVKVTLVDHSCSTSFFPVGQVKEPALDHSPRYEPDSTEGTLPVSGLQQYSAPADSEAEPMPTDDVELTVEAEIIQSSVRIPVGGCSEAEVKVNGFLHDAGEAASLKLKGEALKMDVEMRVEQEPELVPDVISRVLLLKNYKAYCASSTVSTPLPELRESAKRQKYACTNSRINTYNGPKFLCRDCLQPADSDADRETYCRFINFRLFFNDGSSDFLDPRYDVDDDGLKLWLPVPSKYTRTPRDDAAKLILTHASDTFCRVVQEERAVLKAFEKIPPEVRARDGVVFKQPQDAGRETCDVCETTIFNYHWVCPLCGFAVCIDCWCEADEGKQTRPWAQCLFGTSSEEVTKMEHDGKRFLLVQNIPGSILYDVNVAMHTLRRQLGIDASCGCDVQKSLKEPEVVEQVALNSAEKGRAEEKSKIRPKRNVLKGYLLEAARDKYGPLKKKEEDKASLAPKNQQMCTSKCSHTIQGSMRVAEEREAARTGRKACSFLCNGDLVRMESAAHGQTQCMVMFQREWRAGQPVLVVGVNRKMTEHLWRPETFNKYFGHRENDLINSLTGRTLAPRPMKVFWDGFADHKQRMLDSCHRPMLLKLKDWPPSEDFKEIGKKWFDDVMRAFPVSDYTARFGHLNLAWYLPEKFIPPDLGPKMYVAYGSAIHPSISSTNLHLDVSDASNVMAYVGACSVQEVDAWRALDAAVTAGCDISVLDDIRREGRRPGALWHIYDSKDAPKIRDLLMRVRLERNLPLGSHSDPIHDQQTYLDETLRNRLRADYGVVGYSFIQCYGDAVFIPAGAPHQVRNLMNCIKVAEDFVSAETVSHCYSLMKDFRRLSDNHTNHEDKLQVKNMVYHAIKSCIFVLQKPPQVGRGRRQEHSKFSS